MLVHSSSCWCPSNQCRSSWEDFDGRIQYDLSSKKIRNHSTCFRYRAVLKVIPVDETELASTALEDPIIVGQSVADGTVKRDIHGYGLVVVRCVCGRANGGIVFILGLSRRSLHAP